MTTEAITWAELPEDIQQAFGSYERINERMRVFTGATNRLWARKKELTEQYPNQYAAFCGDELVIAKSFPELLSRWNERGFQDSPMAKLFLNAEKRVVIL